jgi:hypothetical protein
LYPKNKLKNNCLYRRADCGAISETAYVLFCHSGLDPWFDRPFDRLTVLSEVEGLTTLSGVEGEPSVFQHNPFLDAGSGPA